ncbi:hypothetical protein DL95DRAFT_34790 [Leptodontidium sp. 2 PMI_412]|nr:hypothetical protein DL95DRAFT_34790 [Leptodontidium sp. 2 PMI_412]
MHILTQPIPRLTKRDVSPDNMINIIIGVLTIVIGILSLILAWATWKLTKDRKRKLEEDTSLPTDQIQLENIERPPSRLGYELALRFGRSQ